MNKLFILLLLTAAIVFGGKFYVERQYEKELDKLIRLAKPYVDLRYKNVSIGFDGSLSLHGQKQNVPHFTRRTFIRK